MTRNDKRDKFFQETLKLIHEKGFKATTMRDIAERMGFEVANIYNYIDSKQSLLETFMFDVTEKFETGLRDILESSYDTTEKLKLVIKLHCTLPAKEPYQIGLMLSEWRHLSKEKLTELVGIRKNYHNKIVGLIQQGMDEGIFRKGNAHIIARTFLSSFQWLYREYAHESHSINPIEMEKQISDFLLNGLKA